MATALRSLFRFLRQRGDITRELAGAIPATTNWRLAEVDLQALRALAQPWPIR